METKFKKPKGFGEVLDHTFSISKNRFKDFFMILLILMGPVYLLEAIIQLVSGISFFREDGSGGFDRMFANFNQTQTINSGSLSSDLGLIVSGLFGFLLFPVAEAAILLAINHIRKNEDYTVGSVIKQSFRRFWPILGSNLLFGLIAFGIMIIPILIVTFTGVFGSFVNPILGIGLAVVLFLGFAVGIGLLFTRWSFYFALVVLEKDSPTAGIAGSWRLTRKRTWILMGLYIVFYLIISSITFAVQMTFGIFLGQSVLLSIISNIISLFTTMFFSVGYGVMFLDLKIRHDTDDLKDMIDEYNTTTL